MDLWLIATTAVVGLVGLAIAAFFVFRSGKKTKNVALIGLMGSGKTKLFYHLVAEHSVSSVTSQATNQFTLEVGSRSVNLIDMPGHARVRTEIMSAVRGWDAVVFVVDATTVLTGQTMNQIANFLYDVLSVERVIARRVPVLVACAKSDVEFARPPDVIQSELELEFGCIRENRLQSNLIGTGDEQQLFLGEEGRKFAFNQIRNPVDCVACSVNENNTGRVREFIANVAKR